MKSDNYKNFEDYLSKSINLLTLFKDPKIVNEINLISEKLITKTLIENRKILIGGNGGSCSDADHFATELIVRYKKKRSPIKCLTLHNSLTTLTAYANDYEFKYSYARVIETFAKNKDILILLSTSGSSENIIEAAKFGKKIGTTNIGIFGERAKSIKDFCNHLIIIPSNETALIQQATMVILHFIAYKLEEALIE